MPGFTIFVISFCLAITFFVFLTVFLNRNTIKVKKEKNELPPLKEELVIRRALKKNSWVQAPKKRIIRCSDGTPLEQNGEKVRCGEQQYPLVGFVVSPTGYLIIINDEAGCLRYITYDNKIVFLSPTKDSEEEEVEE